MNLSDYQQDKGNFEERKRESKEKKLESLSFNVGTSIHVNQLYKGFNYGKKKSSPLHKIHHIKTRDDRTNVCANRKLKQIRLNGFLHPNQKLIH
jgi:hypothetical protein